MVYAGSNPAGGARKQENNTDMYVCKLGHTTSAKNKLEEEFFQYLKEIDRIWVEDEKVEELKKDILSAYSKRCEKHPRCKPLQKSFYKGFDNKEDFILSGSNASFTLLKTK
ncbi:hypothetical protein EGI11_03160 [Chryseobacterium sp. H3056]|uniref:Uncharacterized protein n=1 Tax=Kaistella daneshvariae TaxID=2487074 RepID=A0A3N0WXI1_9FLAO|nr:hypothetical protein [Kaistella daneshvariae]ROI09770.1 hypothetical protein EGI11_03160 [Kaistella daneshvariae]